MKIDNITPKDQSWAVKVADNISSKKQLPPYELSPQKRSRAMKWLKENCPKLLDENEGGCPLCGGTSWNVGPFILEIPNFTFGENIPAEKVYPVVQFRCDSCSNLLFFGAVAVGVIGPDPSTIDEIEKEGSNGRR